MRFLVLLALVGTAIGQSICDNENASSDEHTVASIKGEINEFLGANEVFKYCPEIFDKIMGIEECSFLFNEGYCYFNVGKERYYEVDMDNMGSTLTWDLMRQGVPDARLMGHHLCGNARACYEPAKMEFILTCMANPDFVAVAESVADDMMEYVREELEVLAEEDSALGRIANKARGYMGNYTYEDVKEGYYADEDMYQSYVEAGMEMGAEFCDSNCVGETADALSNDQDTGLLDHLVNVEMCFAPSAVSELTGEGSCDNCQDVCETPAAFCEECQGPAGYYMREFGVPCCLKKVVDAGIAKFEELRASEEWGEEIRDVLDNNLSQEEEEAVRQVLCYRRSYDQACPCNEAGEQVCEVEEEGIVEEEEIM